MKKLLQSSLIGSLLLTASIPNLAATPSTDPDAPSPRITVYVYNYAQVPPSTLEGARGEASNTVRQSLEKSGIPVLVNSGVTLNIGRERIYLAGVDDGWVQLNDLPKALEKHPSGVTAIVLMHAPDFADEFQKDERIDLQLSGQIVELVYRASVVMLGRLASTRRESVS